MGGEVRRRRAAADRPRFTATAITFGRAVIIRDDIHPGKAEGVWFPLSYNGKSLRLNTPRMECSGNVTPSPLSGGSRKPKEGVSLKMYSGDTFLHNMRRIDHKVLRHVKQNSALIGAMLEQVNWGKRFENGHITTLLTARPTAFVEHPYTLRVSWRKDGTGVKLPTWQIERGQLIRASVTVGGIFVNRSVLVVPVGAECIRHV